MLTITTQVNVTNTSTSLSSNATNNETNEGTTVTFTAAVTPTPDGGTVTFTDNSTTISGCGSVAVSSGTATCTTSFSTEGYHPIEAAYNGDTNFGASHGNLNFFVDHATSNPSAGVYCNTGTITINTSTQPGTTPYPQHITVPSTSFTISDISLTLNNINEPDGIGFFNLLLVDPNGDKFVPLAGAGGFNGGSNVTLTLSDSGGSAVPNPSSGSPASGTYLPTDDNSSLTFNTSSYPYNQPSGPYSLPQPQGAATFDTTFGGANPTGQWSLYAYYASGDATGSIGGYCLNITTSNAASTATTVTSSPNVEALTGQQVTFTATVKSGGNPISSGTVTFKENGTTLSGPTALNGSGQASFLTSSLSEGVHTITAFYSGVTGTYQVSSGMVSIEIGTATTNPSAGVYCNPGGIKSGSGSQNIPAAPYPSRVNVTNEAGTVNTVSVELNNYGSAEPAGQVMMLEGPTSTNIVFWNNVGGTNSVSSLNVILADSAGAGDPVPNPPGSSTYYPTSDTSPFPSPAFPAPAPSSLSFAPPQGTQTFTSAFGNINPNGYWSLWVYDRFGSDGLNLNNWCLNVANNPPVVTLSKVHNGTFTQGDSADTYTITVANPSGPGSTAGTMTLTDTLPTGMTATAMSQTGGGTGSDWTCTVGMTSCTRTTAMAPGESDTITLTVNVSYNTSTATNGAVNNVSLSGGGISNPPVTASDTQTVQPGPGYALNLSVSPAGSGTVGANPTNSAGLAAGHYAPGATVNLTATPTQTATIGYTFSSWTANNPGDLSSTSSSTPTITMNSATENVTANFTVEYTQASGTSVSGSGWIYNKVKKGGTSTFTVTNTSGQTISGSIQLVLSGLPAGVTGANNTGSFMGNPYWTVTAGSLAPGASAQVSVSLTYSSGTNFTASSTVYSGNLP